MSSIKLTADSGGGTFEIKAPSSSGNTRVLTLPDTHNLTLNGGKILQVKSTTKTDTFTTTSGTFTDVTGLSVDITPSSTSSKILVTVDITGSGRGGSARVPVRLLRDSTPIGNATDVGNRKASFGVLYTGSDDAGFATANIQFLDSPNTTSSVTYKVQIVNGNNNGSTIVVNRNYSDNNSATNQRYSSSITAEEVAS